MTGTGIFKAFDFKGNQLWERDIQKDYGKFGLNWGYGSSPLLFNGDVIIEVLHGHKTDDPSYVVALNGGSGKVHWRVERPTDAPAPSGEAEALGETASDTLAGPCNDDTAPIERGKHVAPSRVSAEI